MTVTKVHAFGPSTFLPEPEDEYSAQGQTCTKGGISESSTFRQCWNVILALLLLYVGTLLPYRVCFHQLRVGGSIEPELWVEILDYVVDALFWLDLVFNFFFTYRDSNDEEIFDVRLISKSYVKGRFLFDLIACLPQELITLLFVALLGSSSGSSVHKFTRFLRLQKLTKLARMVMLSRFKGQLKAMKGASSFWKWLGGLYGVRIINFMAALFWAVHLLACGWYLCAASHDDPEDTWLYRRSVDAAGTTLLTKGPIEQWAHAMYFVLTVFTTVGFGDISAYTFGEIIYACFLMLVGTVVHSVIMSEIIGICTTVGAERVEAARCIQVLEGFAQHTELNEDFGRRLTEWVDLQAKSKSGLMRNVYDREAMCKMLTDGVMPEDLIHELPDQVFGGRLCQNRFLTVCLSQARQLPPRFCLLVASMAVNRICDAGELIYQTHDHPFNVFLVDMGVFAYVRRPRGDEGHAIVSEKVVAANRVMRRLASTTSSASSGKRADAAPDAVPEEPEIDPNCKYGFPKSSTAGMLPYKLFCHGNFFGDMEIHQRIPRICTARCELPGVLLVLDSRTLSKFMLEFPHFSSVWRAEAVRNERCRVEALRGGPMVASALELAATIIQRYARHKWAWSSTIRLESISSGSDRASTPAGSRVSAPTPGHTWCGPSTPSSGGGRHKPAALVRQVGEELRAEMRAGLASLRAEMLHELRGELRRGLEDRDRPSSVDGSASEFADQAVGPRRAGRPTTATRLLAEPWT